MSAARVATVPLRCPACGEQTHKTLESVAQSHGFRCQCGVFNAIDVEQFAQESRKSATAIEDLVGKG